MTPIWLIFCGIPAVVFTAYAVGLLVWGRMRSWVAIGAVALFGLTFPIWTLLLGYAMQVVGGVIGVSMFGGAGARVPYDGEYPLLIMLSGLLTAGLFLIVTRSKFVCGTTVGASIVAPIGVYLPAPELMPFLLSHIVWHGAVAGALWWWSRRHRAEQAMARLGHCRKCDYDLRGLRSRKCPECGSWI